jgi:hypothetical protein
MIDKENKRYSKRTGAYTIRATFRDGIVTIQQVEKYTNCGKAQYSEDKIALPLDELKVITNLMEG